MKKFEAPKIEELKEHQYCLRCGRKLKKKEWRLLGYGCTCYRKIKKANDKRLSLFQ